MAESEAELAAEVARVTAALKTAIRLSGVSHREIERRLHMSTGYLTRILKGEVDLKVRLVLGVLEVIGFPEGNFFGALYRPTPPDSLQEARLARGLASLHMDEMEPGDPEAIFKELRGHLQNLSEFLERADRK